MDHDFSALEMVEIVGGEPLLNLDHLDFLQHIVDQGHAQHVCLIYVTNCTNPLSARTAAVLGAFQQVKFNLSIDAVGDRFAYVRTGGRWSQVLHALDTIRSRLPQAHLSVNAVVSALNVLYLDELVAWCVQQDLSISHMHMAYQPDHYSMQVFDQQQRSLIIEILQQSQYHHRYQGLLEQIAGTKSAPDLLEKFLREASWTQNYWGMKLSDYLPELADLLGHQ
jgi:MoaA/NifB/PqqE/SkfB family radical SAM enzyme